MADFSVPASGLFGSTPKHVERVEHDFVTPGQAYREVHRHEMTPEKRADKNMLSKFLYDSHTNKKGSVFNMMKNLEKTNTPLYQERDGKAVVLGKTLEQKPSYNTCRFVDDFFGNQLHFHISTHCDEVKPNERKIWMHCPKDSTWNKHQANGGFLKGLEE